MDCSQVYQQETLGVFQLVGYFIVGILLTVIFWRKNPHCRCKSPQTMQAWQSEVSSLKFANIQLEKELEAANRKAGKLLSTVKLLRMKMKTLRAVAELEPQELNQFVKFVSRECEQVISSSLDTMLDRCASVDTASTGQEESCSVQENSCN